MELDFTFFAVAVPAALFAGIDKAGFGSSASVAAAAAMSLILPPGEVIAIMLPLLIAMDFVALRPNWGKWDVAAARILLPGTILGAILGAGLIFVISADLFRAIIGVIALGFVAYQVARRAGVLAQMRPFSRPVGFGLSVGAGITSFTAHAGGPLASIYLLSLKLGKEAYQATTIIVFWVNNLLKIALYLWLGLICFNTTIASVYLLPVAVLGTLIGVRLNRIVPERIYFTCIYVFLSLAGTKLIWDALG